MKLQEVVLRALMASNRPMSNKEIQLSTGLEWEQVKSAIKACKARKEIEVIGGPKYLITGEGMKSIYAEVPSQKPAKEAVKIDAVRLSAPSMVRRAIENQPQLATVWRQVA